MVRSDLAEMLDRRERRDRIFREKIDVAEQFEDATFKVAFVHGPGVMRLSRSPPCAERVTRLFGKAQGLRKIFACGLAVMSGEPEIQRLMFGRSALERVE